ncbi:hypothetical protein H7097_04420 [Aeromicrobium sp.]|nr:hypothetical protein [Candidatus Saccharibacteria bacterium]
MRQKYKQLFVCFGILVAITAAVSVITPANTNAAVNQQINFQGKLANPDGTNVTDGNYSIVFSIYSVASAGTAIWTETQGTVAVSGGNFQVQLGSVNTALASLVDFNTTPLYLGVKIGTDAEMTPRVQFTAAPYALNSDKLGGLNSSGFIQIGPGSVQNDGTTNASVFLNKTAASGNILQLQKNGADIAVIDNTGSTTFGQATKVQNGTYTSGLFLINNGLTSATPAFPNAYSPSLAVRSSQTSGSRPLFLGYDDGTGTGWASYINAGACGSFTTMCFNFGVGATNTVALENSGTNLFVGGGDDGNFTNVIFKNTGSVIVGSQTTDANQVLLQPDSFSTLADTATCTTTTNQGAMYYSTATGGMRACINGAWEDLISTGGLGLLAYGVVPDSANAGTPGDIAGVSNYSNSPCKVVWTATQQVTVSPCVVFSGGRKLVIPSTALSTTGLAANVYANICISTPAGAVTTTGLPVLLTGNATETSATLPVFSANNPVACFATVRASATAGNVGFIWDTRTFTNTQKQFATINSVNNAGFIVVGTTTMGVTQTVATVTTGPIRGIVVATAGTASTTTVNAIIASVGPAFVKFPSGATATPNNVLQTNTTAGYGTSNASPAIGAYLVGGLLMSSISTSCTTTNTLLSACQYSPLVDFRPSR